ADRGVALALAHRLPAERRAVEEQYVVPDHGRLADHDAHPVVDEQAAPDARTRVDLDPGEEARELRHEPGREAGGRVAPQPVRDPVRPHRVQTWVGEGDLDPAARRGVPQLSRREVLAERREEALSRA